MISVIIPVLNEEKCLPQTLGHLDRMSGNFEIIAVDGGSTDASKRILALLPKVRVLSARRGRAPQMNAGAAAARGDWLLFLHADTHLPDNALALLDSRIDDLSLQAGCFRHRFSGRHWGLRFISWLHNWRFGVTNVIYGDQAMFVRRAFFRTLGGFPEDAEMEDIAFCERMLRTTRPVMLEDHVVTDSRKFEQMGIWRSFLRLVVILTRHEMGLSVAKNQFFSDVR